MRIAIVNLVARTVRSSGYFPQFDKDIPSSGIQAESPMVLLLADELARRQHVVDVFVGSIFEVIRDPESRADQLAHIVRMKERMRTVFPPSYYPFTPSLAKTLQSGGYDAVLTSEMTQPATIISQLSVAPPTKVYVWQEVSLHPRFPANMASKSLFATQRLFGYRKLTAAIPRSSAARDFLVSEGVPAMKVTEIVPNAVDCDCFRPHVGEDYFESHGLADHYRKPRILMVSRLVSAKGIDTFVDAASIILRKGIHASFVVKGTGPYVNGLKKRVKAHGIEKNFLLIEEYLPRKNLALLMASCDICAAPSSGDLLFFVPLEAMASGLPVVTTTATHHIETFSNGLSGTVIPPDDPSQLALALMFLIENRDRLATMSSNARAQAVRDFSVMSVADKMDKILRTG